MDLDALGQQPGLQIYTQITYCFGVPKDSSREKIIDILENGLQKVYASFPWTAGQVVNEEAGPGSTGWFRFRPLDRAPQVVLKDIDGPGYTMKNLQQTGFPARLLDETVVAPRRTLPGFPDEAHLNDKPCFLVQAGFIPGGLLLTFVGEHAAMDMTGQGELIRLFAKACQGEAFTEEEVATGNMERYTSVPLLDKDVDPKPFIKDQLASSNPSPTGEESTTPAEPVSSSWKYFKFTAEALRALKQAASATLPEDGDVKFVSTDDALTALIWQSVLTARQGRLKHDCPVTFARAVDVRKIMGLPQRYSGMMQNMNIHLTNVRQVCDAPLGHIAAELRSKLLPAAKERLRERTRALFTYIDRSPDKNAAGIAFTGPVDANAGGLALSSWAKAPSQGVDFGLGLGKPECVRRPQFSPVKSLLYLMPKADDGSIAALLCLRDEDMSKLRESPVFTKYAEYIG